MKNYEIKLNEVQMRIISNALDVYSRLGIAQLEAVVNLFREDDRVETESLKAFESLINTVKQIVFDMSPNASYGIANEKVPEIYKVARDMNMSIEHQLWKDKENSAIFSIHSTPPFAFGQQPLMEIK